jgi:hypothetical protein
MGDQSAYMPAPGYAPPSEETPCQHLLFYIAIIMKSSVVLKVHSMRIEKLLHFPVTYSLFVRLGFDINETRPGIRNALKM